MVDLATLLEIFADSAAFPLGCPYFDALRKPALAHPLNSSILSQAFARSDIYRRKIAEASKVALGLNLRVVR